METKENENHVEAATVDDEMGDRARMAQIHPEHPLVGDSVWKICWALNLTVCRTGTGSGNTARYSKLLSTL